MTEVKFKFAIGERVRRTHGDDDRGGEYIFEISQRRFTEPHNLKEYLCMHTTWWMDESDLEPAQEGEK